MSYSLQLPNGQIVHGIDDAFSQEEAYAILRQKLPDAFPKEAPPPAAPKQHGIMASLAKGTESTLENFLTAGQALFGDKQQAAKDTLARNKALDARYEEAGDMEKVRQAYEQGGFMAAAKEVIRQFPNVVAENIPNIVAMAATAKAGAALGSLAGPVGTVVGGLAGGLAGSAGMQFGSNIQRQAQQQQDAGQPLDPNLATAGGAALAQGALDVASLKMLGGKTISRWLGFTAKAGDEVAEKALLKAAEDKALAAATKEGAQGFWNTAARGVGKGIAAEVPTEVAQQVLERAQAGLPLLSDDALQEYGQTAYQTAMVGGALGPVGSFTDRSVARDTKEEIETKRVVQANAEKAAAEAAKRADPAWQNSVEGLQEQQKALKAQLADLRKQIGEIKPVEKGAPLDADAQQTKDALSAQHKDLLEQYKALGQRLIDAKKSPEQFMVDNASELGSEVVTPPEKPAAEFLPGVPMSELGEQPADSFAPNYHTADAQDALLLSLTNPEAYALWQKQAQREREAGLLHGMGEPGQLAAPVEDMAPVFGPNGMVVGYRPIAPGEAQARPQFELGQQLPAMQQQALELPEVTQPAPTALAAPVVPGKPRITTQFASAAPMPKAYPGEIDNPDKRIGLPVGLNPQVKPGGLEQVRTAQAPQAPQQQSMFPVEEGVADQLLNQPGTVPESLLPRSTAPTGALAQATTQPEGAEGRKRTTLTTAPKEDVLGVPGTRSGVSIMEQAAQRAKAAFSELVATLQDLKNTRTNNDPTQPAIRPKAEESRLRKQMLAQIQDARERVLRSTLREVIEKRAALGLPPMNRDQAIELLSNVSAMLNEMEVRSLADPVKVRGAFQKLRFDKGVLHNAKQAASVQDALRRIRERIYEIHRELYGSTATLDTSRGNDALARLLVEAGFEDKGTGAEPTRVNRVEKTYTPDLRHQRLLEEEQATLVAREAGLEEKLRKYFAGKGATPVVVQPAPKERGLDFQMSRPFGDPKAAAAAIAEQIERQKDKALQTPENTKTRVPGEFELGKQFLDPNLAPKPEPVEESFPDAALEAEVTGKQKTLFDKEALPPRGANMGLVRMFQGKFRAKMERLKEALRWVNKAIEDQATTGTDLAQNVSRMNTLQATLQRLTGLLTGQKYGPEVRAQVDKLVADYHAAKAWANQVHEMLVEARNHDALLANMLPVVEGSAETPPVPGKRWRVPQSEETKRLEYGSKQAAITARKAELALKPYLDLSAQIDSLLRQYDEVKTALDTAQKLVETARGQARAGAERVGRNVVRAQEKLGEAVTKANAAVQEAATEVRETKQRFDTPPPPKTEPRPRFPLITPYERTAVNPETGKEETLRTGKTALESDSDIARMANEGYTEPKRKFPGGKAIQNQEVQRRAFEEQTGQVGQHQRAVEESAAEKRARAKAEEKQFGEAEEAPEVTDIGETGLDWSDKGDLSLRVGEKGATTIAPEEAQGLADKAKQLIPSLQYYPTAAHVPLEVRERLAKDGIDYTQIKGGAFEDGTVIMIGDAHTDAADFAETVAHELIGHYKMDRIMFGSKTGLQLMQAMANKYFSEPGEATKLMYDLGFDGEKVRLVLGDARRADENGQDGKLVMMREIVARVAEMKPGSFTPQAKGFWGTLARNIVNFLRDAFGINLGKLTPEDIFFMVKRAQEGEIRTTEGGPTAARTVNSPAHLNAAAERIFPTPPGTLETFAKKGFGLTLRTQYIDRFAPLVEVAKRIASDFADSIRASQLVYYLRAADRVNQFVGEVMTHGPVALAKSPDGKGYLFQSTKGANAREMARVLRGEDHKLWATYMALERAQKDNVGLSALLGDKAPQLSDAEIKEILDYGRNNAAYQTARKLYKDMNTGMVNLLVQTGFVDQKTADRWLTGDYIPYYRVEANGDLMLEQGSHPQKIGNIRDQKDIAALFGSDKQLNDPFINMARNTRLLVGAAIRNEAAKNTAYELQKLGLGNLINNDLHGSAERSASAIHFRDHGGEKTFVIDTSKNARYADIPPDLIAKGMEGIPTQLPDILKWMQIPSKFLRDLITLNPLYMVRQMTRDPVHAWLSTGVDTKSVLGAYKRALNLMQHKDATGELLRERGLIGGQLVQGNDEDIRRILTQVQDGQGGMAKLVTWLHDKGVAADAATRAALYDDFTKKKGMSDLEATVATMDSVNFATRGMSPSMQALNMVVPFFNAQIQGLDSVYRALRGKMPFNERLQAQRKLVQRAMMIAAGTVAYYALVHDEDWYKNQPENVRMQNWLLPPLPGMKEPIKIPRPFEFGWMFAATPEAILMAGEGNAQSKAALSAWLNQAVNQLPGGSSLIMPAAAKPLVEVAANHSFFTGKEIIPKSLQDVPSDEQYTSNTTEAAKLLGSTGIAKAINLSPLDIENIVKGYTAAIGYSTLQLLDGVLSNSRVAHADKPLSRTPIVGPLFADPDAGAIITRAYDTAARFDAEAKRLKAAKDQNRVEDAKQILAEHGTEIALNKAGAQFKAQMAKFTQAERAIQFAPPPMTREQKNEALDKLRKAKIAYARQFEEATNRLAPQ